jgi:hypothetical protein
LQIRLHAQFTTHKYFNLSHPHCLGFQCCTDAPRALLTVCCSAVDHVHCMGCGLAYCRAWQVPLFLWICVCMRVCLRPAACHRRRPCIHSVTSHVASTAHMLRRASTMMFTSLCFIAGRQACVMRYCVRARVLHPCPHLHLTRIWIHHRRVRA